MEYVGEVLDYREFRRRSKQYSRSNLKHFYFMALNADEVIDATQKGNISRFINHSCDPNCETQKVRQIFIVIVSNRDCSVNICLTSQVNNRALCFWCISLFVSSLHYLWAFTVLGLLSFLWMIPLLHLNYRYIIGFQ